MKPKKIIYYRDDSDDMTFFESLKTVTVDKNYDYERKGPWNWFLRNILIRGLVVPFAFVFRRFFIRTRYVNRKVLRRHKGGCFIYSNHTEVIPEAFRAVSAAFPHYTHIIVHPNNVSVPHMQGVMMAGGCLPLPNKPDGMRNFLHAVERCCSKGPVVIFPERVIWPYYTKIRRFSDANFHYPVKFDKPVFTMTVTYHKGKLFDKPYKIAYIDGPFYPDKELPPRERQKKLCDTAYQTMCERAKLNTYSYYEYVQRDDAPEYRAKLAEEEAAQKSKKEK